MLGRLPARAALLVAAVAAAACTRPAPEPRAIRLGDVFEARRVEGSPREAAAPVPRTEWRGGEDGEGAGGLARVAKAARLKPDSEATKGMSAEQLEQLRSLGYVK